ncbi:Hypothetical predicted protein [Olea europaea subsp. europaea]|uniref:Uncharacterized protein n=1 Tax=Olea europaea subsp. europaea TaxID=158383 RepID=A0A8S0V9F1_OLEEU|nr:Hypothetical predicted protein [Olea europaea subsp. europaea]
MACISLTRNTPESASGDERFPAVAAEEEDRCSSCRRHPRLRSGRTVMSQTARGRGFSLVSSLDLMDSKPVIVSLKALRAFHSIDGALYAILVTEPWRYPVESLQIIALWLWLEHVGFGRVTRKILAFAPLFINQTAEEAAMCIKCIKDSHFIHSAEAIDIPMTRSIVEKEISLRFFNENRVTASREVGRIINQDCLYTMRDITEKALHGNSGESSSRNWLLNPLNAAQSSPSNSTLMPFNGRRSSRWNQMMISSNANTAESSYRNQMIRFNASRRYLSNPIVMPFNGGPSSGYSQMMIPSNDTRRSLSNPTVMPSNLRRRSGLNEMMMSRHFHESMIHNFSNMRVGRNAFPRNNQLINKEVRPYEQPLYARVVFLKASFVQEILDGTEKAKFTINGKHVWMRKFVPRNEGPS